jgi:hypothetical protein
MGLVRIAEWYEEGDRAFGHVEIVETRLSLVEVGQLIHELREVYSEMNWHMAEWLYAAASGLTKNHIFSKADYEQDRGCRALCGKKPHDQYLEPVWSGASPLPGDPGTFATCQSCRALWIKRQERTKGGSQS